MSDDHDIPQLAADLRTSFGQLTRRIKAEVSLPLSQAQVLGRLDREGPKSTSDLASAARVRPQSMAQTVQELEAAGYVTRRPDPDDKRRAFVTLTDAGQAAIEADRARRDSWLAQVLAELSEEERATLAAAAPVLRKIADA